MSSKPQHQYRYQQLRPKVLKRDNYRCHWCGIQLRRPGSDVGAPPHVDHVVPVALGGAPFDMANLVASCRRCNLSKGAKMVGRRRILRRRRRSAPRSRNW